jgi:hypothetical protein
MLGRRSFLKNYDVLFEIRGRYRFLIPTRVSFKSKISSKTEVTTSGITCWWNHLRWNHLLVVRRLGWEGTGRFCLRFRQDLVDPS